jgi:hypothetical protein
MSAIIGAPNRERYTGPLEFIGQDLDEITAAIRAMTPPRWTSIPFLATNFTGLTTMIWTVVAGDVETLGYVRNGSTVILAFTINTTTVAGTPTNRLRIKLPAELVPARTIRQPCQLFDNSSTGVAGVAIVTAVGSGSANVPYLLIGRVDNGNFTASSRNTYALGQIIFEVVQ